MRIKRVTSESDLGDLFSFRYCVLVEQLGWLPPNRSRHLRDDFDTVACNYAALDSEGVIIGSVRVVPDGPLGLPLEHCFPLDGLRAGRRLAEICRLAVAPEYRGARLAGLLMKAAYQCAVASGATHLAVDAFVGRESGAALYAKMGFERLGGPCDDPEYLCDEPAMSFWLDVERAEREWPTERPGLYRFFTSRDNSIHHD